MAELTKEKFGKIFSYARQQGYEGVVVRDEVFLFSNKKIERIEQLYV